MPSTAKPKTSSRSNTRSAKNASSKSSSPKSRAAVDSVADHARNAAGTVAKGTAAAAVGTAVAAFAGRALIASRRRRRVLGVPLPRRRTNAKRVAGQFSNLAAELEKKSLDVSEASGRVKHAAKMLS